MNSEKTSSEAGLKRIFLGVPVSQEVREKAKELGKELEKVGEGLKIVQAENLHLTLKFIGEVKAEKLEKIKVVLKKIDLGEKFKVKVRELGAFPNENYVRVIWLGLEDSQRIFDLQKKVDFALSKMFSIEKDFLAHLTLSRVKFVQDKNKLKEFLAKFKRVDLGETIIDKVVLYESELKKSGPEYKVLAEYQLR